MPNQITINLGSYRVIFTQQLDAKAWLVKEFSGTSMRPFNTYAITTKRLRKTISRTIGTELEG